MGIPHISTVFLSWAYRKKAVVKVMHYIYPYKGCDYYLVQVGIFLHFYDLLFFPLCSRSTLNQSLLKAKKPQFIPLPPSPPLPVHDSPPPMTPTHLSSLTCVPVSPPPSPHASLPSSPPPSGHSSFSPPPPTHASLSPPTHTHLSPSPIPLTHTSLPPIPHSPTHAVIPSAQDYLTPLEELQTAGLGVSGPGPDGTKHIH